MTFIPPSGIIAGTLAGAWAKSNPFTRERLMAQNHPRPLEVPPMRPYSLKGDRTRNHLRGNVIVCPPPLNEDEIPIE